MQNSWGKLFMKVKAYTLNSFAKCTEGGNPAGVVLNADDLRRKTAKNPEMTVPINHTAVPALQ